MYFHSILRPQDGNGRSREQEKDRREMGDVDQKREAGRHMVTDSEVEETKRKPSPTRAHLLTQKRDAQAQGHGRLWRKGKRCAGNGRTDRPAEQPRAGGAPGTVRAPPGRRRLPGAGAGPLAGRLLTRRSQRLSGHSVFKRASHRDSLDALAKLLTQNTDTKTIKRTSRKWRRA